MNSVEQCNVQHAIGGLEAAEGYLSTTVDLTKQMKPSFALPPLLGGRVAVKRQQNRRKEGRCVCVIPLYLDMDLLMPPVTCTAS